MSWLILLTAVSLGGVNGQAITSRPKDFTGIVGGTATFKCQVEFSGAHSLMSWEFNDNAIYNYQYGRGDYPMRTNKYTVTKDDQTFMLTVMNLNYSDAGMYQCHVVDVVEKAALLVLGTLKLQNSTPNQIEGETARYTCTAQFAGPEKADLSPGHYPQLSMSFGGASLNGKVMQQEPDGAKYFYTLQQAHNLTLEANMHGKMLSCTIGTSSPAMQLNVTTEVAVLYPVCNIDYKPRSESYEIGMAINCIADGNPKPQFLWDERITGNVIDGPTLKISEHMVGKNTWRCTANNTVNGRSHQENVVAVFLAVPPGILQDPEIGSSQSRDDTWKIVVGVSVPVCLAMIIGLAAAVWYCRRNKSEQKKKRLPPEGHSPDVDHGMNEDQKTERNPLMTEQYKQEAEEKTERNPLMTEQYKQEAEEKMERKHLMPEKYKQEAEEVEKKNPGKQQEETEKSRSAQLMTVIADLKYENISENVVKKVRELSPNQNFPSNGPPALILLEIAKNIFSCRCKDTKDENGESVLHKMASVAHIWKIYPNELEVAVKSLFDTGADITNKQKQGDTPLHIFISKAGEWKNHAETFLRIAKVFLSPGIVDITNNSGATPLHLFTEWAGEWKNQLQAFLKIAGNLKSSTNIDIQNTNNATPLHLLTSKTGEWKNYPEEFLAVAKFLKSTKNIDLKNSANETALYLFTSMAGEWKGNPKTFLEVVNFLISSTNKEIQNYEDMTALHAFLGYAGEWKDKSDPFLEVVKCLKSPNNIDLKNMKGEAALHIFIDKAHEWKGCSKTFGTVVEWLRSEKNIAMVYDKGKTALNIFLCNYVEWKDHPELFQRVISSLKSHLILDVRNGFGETALQVFTSKAHEWKAQQKDFFNVLQCLISQTNLDVRNNKGAIALHSFIETSHEWGYHPVFLEIIKCLKSKTNIDMRNDEGATALYLFTSQAGKWKQRPKKFLEVVKFLKTNQNINMMKTSSSGIQNSKGKTALHLFASMAGEWKGNPDIFLEVVKTLVSPINTEIQDSEDATALHTFIGYAGKWKDNPEPCLKIVQQLKSSTNINLRNVGGATALHTFISKLPEWRDNSKAIFNVIQCLKSTVNIDMVTSAGETVLHTIIGKAFEWDGYQETFCEVVRCLRSSSNINIKDSQTALQIFTKKADQWQDHTNLFLSVVRCLKSSKNIYYTSNNHETALTNFLAWEDTWKHQPMEFMKVVRCLIFPTIDENVTDDALVNELNSWVQYWLKQNDTGVFEVLRLLSSPTITHYGPENGIKLLVDLFASFEENVGLQKVQLLPLDNWHVCYLKTVEAFISYCKVNGKNLEGARPLHMFAEQCDRWVNCPETFPCVLKLFKSITDTDTTDEYCKTALHLFTFSACEWSDYPHVYLEVIVTLHTPKNIYMQDNMGRIALHSFVYYADKWANYPEYFLKVIARLSSPVNINIQKKHGVPALHEFAGGARAWGNHPEEFIEVLQCLKSPSNIDMCDRDGDTVLHYLFQSLINWKDCSHETISEINKFLRFDDDIEIYIKEGNRKGVMFTCDVKTKDLKEVLEFVQRNVSHKTEVIPKGVGWKEIQVFESETKKWEESAEQFLEVVTKLASPININWSNQDGDTPLHRFARCSSKWADHIEKTSKIFNCLVSPENISMENNFGKTAKDLLEENWGECAKPFLKIVTPMQAFHNILNL